MVKIFWGTYPVTGVGRESRKVFEEGGSPSRRTRDQPLEERRLLTQENKEPDV